ncbi:MAG TPA: SGNH/GDSL hydrolase family protein [Candidatus Pelethocola excrementipullorum]|nr:SGNH/GDSL hydrolase family protein [Candidatus Pelethocola excrementipullorum]
MGLDKNSKNILVGKTIYAFGDSIVEGHAYTKASFVEFVAEQERMDAKKFARNGATILPSDNHILSQLSLAPKEKPDYILFDGGTNDAYVENVPRLGVVEVSFDSKDFNQSTFAGAFEHIICEMKRKWPDAHILYIAAHKMGMRDWKVQELLHRLEMKICNKWKIPVVNLYEDTTLDTREDWQRKKYSFDVLGDDGLPGTEDTVATSDNKPTGTHPNIHGIKKFYVPAVTAILHQLEKESDFL